MTNPDIVDVQFALQGQSVPEDHADALWLAIRAVLPWLESEPLAGIHPLAGLSPGENLWYLSRRSRLSLRLPRARAAAVEALVGAPLIERGARRIRLTALGETFVERGRDILRAVDELGGLARASRDPMTGPLRLGVIPTVAPYLLPELMQALGARFPSIDLRPREAVTQKLVEDLNDGKLDAAIVALPVSEPALHEEPLFEEEFVLVRPVEDAHRPVPNPATLRAMRLLLLEEGHCFRDQALSFCKMESAVPRDLMEASSLSTLVQMVAAGIGVTLIPKMAVPVETRSGRVAVARLGPPHPTRRIGLVWRKTNPLGADLRRIARLVAETAVPDPGGSGAGGGAVSPVPASETHESSGL